MDDELEFTSKQTEQDNVAGISRSGRLRKKSMKLRDFESLDDVDSSGRSSNPGVGASSSAKVTSTGRSVTVGNAAVAGLTSPARFTPKQPLLIKEEISSEEELFDATMYTVKSEYEPIKQETCSEIENEHDMNVTQNDESSLDSTGSEFDELDESVHQDKDMEEDGFQAIGSADYASPAAAQSIYLLEKSPVQKKLVIKDGEINEKAKTQRKDKVPPRVTSYMLWSKNIRQELIKKNPEWDFSQTRKRLGELWATIPYDEKYIWKRRAIRLATKAVTNKTSAGPLTSPTTVVTTGCVQQQQQQRRDVSPPIKRLKFPPGTSRKSPGSGAVVVKNQLVPSPAALNSRDKMATEETVAIPTSIIETIRRWIVDFGRGAQLVSNLESFLNPSPRAMSACLEINGWLSVNQHHANDLELFFRNELRSEGRAAASDDTTIAASPVFLTRPARGPCVPVKKSDPDPTIELSESESDVNHSVRPTDAGVGTITRPLFSTISRVVSPSADEIVTCRLDKNSAAVDALRSTTTFVSSDTPEDNIPTENRSGRRHSVEVHRSPRPTDSPRKPAKGHSRSKSDTSTKTRTFIFTCPICKRVGPTRSWSKCYNCESIYKRYAPRNIPHHAECKGGISGDEIVVCKRCICGAVGKIRRPSSDRGKSGHASKRGE